MEEFELEVEEILQKVVKVKANSFEEAMQIVQKQYDDCEIILDEHDIKEITVRKHEN